MDIRSDYRDALLARARLSRDLRRAVGHMLRLWRALSGRTQVDVGAAASIDGPRLSRLERGGGIPSAAEVRQVADAIGPVFAPPDDVADALRMVARAAGGAA